MSNVKPNSSRMRRSSASIALVIGVALTMMSAASPVRSRAAGMPEPKLLTSDGGRIAWYHGEKHELIAFDAVADQKTKATELYTMNPDGSGRRCVTCNADVPKGFVGQPEWHPDGEHIIIQVENSNSKHTMFNHMSWGIDDDLWIIRRDGTGAERIWETPPQHAALHPHFNDDGTLLIFSERVPTGKKLSRPIMRLLTPGGENPWDGWRIHIASFDVNKTGTSSLSNHRTIQPNGPGFYETHQFHNANIVYSHTDNGMPYVANVFEVATDGRSPKGLTRQNGTWNEHGLYSPDGKYLAFVSSRFDKSWHYPGSRAQDLRTELYVEPAGGNPEQITDMNQRKGEKIAVSDYDWDRASRRIAVQVAVLSGRTNPEIYVLNVR